MYYELLTEFRCANNPKTNNAPVKSKYFEKIAAQRQHPVQLTSQPNSYLHLSNHNLQISERTSFAKSQKHSPAKEQSYVLRS